MVINRSCRKAKPIFNEEKAFIEKHLPEIETAQKLTTGFGLGENTTYCVSPRFFRNKTEPYFSSEELCEDYTRVMELFLNISEWQAQNDVPPNGKKWYIRYYNNKCNTVFTESDSRDFMEICFSSSEKAEQAIDKFHDEINWYFTRFKQRLDM